MPEAAAAVVAWVASAASYVASASSAVAAGTATFAQVATVVAVNVAVTVGANAAVSALSPKPNVNAGGSPIEVRLDPDPPLALMVGRTAHAGRPLHHNAVGGSKNYLSFLLLLSALPITSIESFTANAQPVVFGTDAGEGASGFYQNRMWQVRTLGAAGGSYLKHTATGTKDTPANHQGNLPEWTAAHKLTNCAAALWTMRADPVKYSTGLPRPLFVGLGVTAWDPRFDSTYPGGEGSQRRDDWRTWGYTANPHLHALAWARGHRAQRPDGTLGSVLLGIGAPDHQIDIGSFVEAANVALANGWTLSGVPTSDDDPKNVLEAMLQAGGGQSLSRGGRIGVIVNAPKASVVTITREDLAGEPVIDTSSARRDRINIVIPKFRQEQGGWETLPGQPVSVQAYQDEDGEERPREIEYPYVGGGDEAAAQAAQLAAYDVVNTREGITGALPCKPHMIGLRAGHGFTADEPEWGLNGQKCVVTQRDFDLQTGVVTIAFRSETDPKHDFALGRTDVAPPTPALTGVDPSLVPAPAAGTWAAAAAAVTGTGGAQVPVVRVSLGPNGIDNTAAEETIVGVRRVGPAPANEPLELWKWEAYPGTNVIIDVRGLGPRTRYEVAVRYKVRGVDNPEVYTSLGFFVTPDLVASNVTHLGERPIADVLRDIGAAGGQSVRDLRRSLANVQLDRAESVFRIGAELQQRRHVAVILSQMPNGEPVSAFARRVTTELKTETTALAADTTVLVSRTNGLEAVQISDRTTFTDLNTARAQETSALTVRAGQIEATAVVDRQVAATANSARASETTALAGRVDTAEATIITNRQLDVEANNVRISEHAALVGRVATAEGAIVTNRQLDISADAARIGEINALLGRVGTAEGAIVSNRQLDVEANQLRVNEINGLLGRVGTAEGGITTERDLRIAADSALGTRIDNVSVTLDGRYASITRVDSVELALDGRIKAIAGLAVQTNNEVTGYLIDGVIRDINFTGSSFRVTDKGNGLSYEPLTGRLKITRDGQKTVLGAGGSLTLWAGSTSVPDGGESYENGVIAIGAGAPGGGRFSGQTLAGNFNWDLPNGAGAPDQNWHDVAVTQRYTTQGFFSVYGRFTGNGQGTPVAFDPETNTTTLQWVLRYRIVSTNLGGGDLVELHAPQDFTHFYGAGQTNTSAEAEVYRRAHLAHPRSGERLIKLQFARGLGTASLSGGSFVDLHYFN
jgi:hypothetical protein